MRNHKSGFKIFVIAATLSVSVACLSNKSEAGIIRPVEKGIVAYPDNIANPRQPTITFDGKGAIGNGIDVETNFAYQLAPLIDFKNGGSASFSIRDTPRRTEKTVLSLMDDKISLNIIISPASEGRKIVLVLKDGAKIVAKSPIGPASEKQWKPLDLKWTAAEAILKTFDGAELSLKLPANFNPKRFMVEAYHVDELALKGDGGLKLDWESGYAATGEYRASTDKVALRLHGFDAMVVSNDPLKRDYPFIQLCNASNAERKVTLRFSLKSEIRNRADDWYQEVKVPPNSSVETPIKFPVKLDTDIYHLSTQVEGAEMNERDALRNFLFAKRRDEPAGPAKFGFHTYGVSTPGSWPDALPVHWRHMYANWGYIVGPMWVNDEPGKPGLNPDTPPEQWWWESRVDWTIKEGRKTLVCLLSVPYFPWMREKEFDATYMNKTYPWGKAGGRPNFARYRQFVKAAAERYKGKVDIYELDNESNTVSYSGKPAADYADVMKAAGEEIHAVDPRAKVYGISGTSQFVDYMRDAFATGAAKYIDGVSWHTYTTPMLPGDSGLPQMLKRANEVIAATGRKLPVMNSETGVYAALRETFDQPIRPERLAELIKQGVQPIQVPTGWPSYALEEKVAAKSVLQNIVFNFAAGAGQFLFFGWDPQMEKGKSWWGESGEGCFNIFSRVKDGTMTPSLYTLACAVAMTQMEGAITEKSAQVNQDGIIGATFEKADGGQLAVLWSGSGRRTAMLQTSCPEIGIVSLFGIEKTLVAKGGPNSYLHRIELDDSPIYIHLKKPGITLSPSPVIGFERTPGTASERKISFTLVNRFETKWTGAIEFASAEKMPITPAKVGFSVDPGARSKIETVCVPPQGMAKGIHLIEAATKLPDGSQFVFPIEIDVRPSFTVGRVANEFSMKDIRDWKPQGGELAIDRPEQVAIGRPPELTSIQEERYWKGPNELSAKVATGYNDKGFFARIIVRDKNRGPLKTWPGVEGSCLEWFFDFRSPGKGLGSAPYDKGVTQIVAKPAFSEKDKVELWSAGNTPEPFKGVEAVGGAADASSYWVGIFVPWTAVDSAAKVPDSIGFDVGVDGPPAGAVGRKSQIFLFGGAYDNKDASGFGAAILKK
ncbi:MAG: hypothetical protein WC637_01125 [Victivallales bacterium]|jgi:hypothetical protein